MKQSLLYLLLLALPCFAQTNNARMLSGVNPQTGTSYPFVAADATRLTTFSNASAVAATLPSGANFGFGAGTMFSVQDLGPSSVTITCSGCLFFSSSATPSATLILVAGQGTDLYSNGQNYYAQLGGVASYPGVHNNFVYVDGGTAYPFTSTGINAAITAACNGTIPGTVVLFPTAAGAAAPITAQITPVSNCTIQGPGKNLLTLQASATYNAGTMIPIAGRSNVVLQGFAVDGNRGSNANNFELIHVDNSTNVTLSDLLVANGQTTAISLNGTGKNIVIRNSEIKNTGLPIPSPAGGGIGVSAAGAMSGIVIDGNYIHGNNAGIAVFNSASTDAVTGLKIINNTVNGNGADAILISGVHNLGGSISQAQIENNEAGCNGWLLSGVGFSANCIPDFLQAMALSQGAGSSFSGVGVDVTGVLVNAPTIVGNNLHDNVFDGISIGTPMNATVNTSGSTITCANCGVTFPPMNTRWLTGQIVTVNGAVLAISSCSSITTCTTTTPVGTHTNAAFLGPTTVNAVVSGNVSFHNFATGYFNFFSDGNQYSGNTANLNGLEGFGLSSSTGVIYSGGSAISNDTTNNGGSNAGFVIILGFQTQIKGVFTNDYQSFQTQQAGVLVTGGSVNTVIESNGLNAPSTPVSNAGTNTTYSDGAYLGTAPGALFVSQFCGSITSCPWSTDESTAIVAAEKRCQGTGSSNSTCHIVDDMCGVQQISVQPFNMVGRFDFENNCSDANPHIWSLDGIGTLTTPHSGLTITSMGGNGFLQSPTNVYIQAANCLLDNCVNGGFTTISSAISSTVVAGGVMTINFATPMPINGNGPGMVAAGRGIYIAGSTTQVTNNGLWIVLNPCSAGGCVTTTSQVTVGVVNGTTLSCTPGTCGTATLDAPIFEIGGSTGGGVFDTTIDHALFDCHFVIACTGPVNGIGQENTGWGTTHVSNTDTWYYRLEQSAAYNGSNTNGDVNSGPYGPMTGNINPQVCNHTGGCACKVGTANGACPSSPQPVGTLMTCGAGTTGTAAIIVPDPCDNPNFVGVVVTGVGGAQGPREVVGATISIQDKTAAATAIVGLRGGNSGAAGSVTATSSWGLLVCGSRFTSLDFHIEFMEDAVEFGCSPTRNATWYAEYGGFITSAVSMTGGLWGFQSTGVGLEVGFAGNGALVQDVCVNNVAIGANSGTIIIDNIYGITLTGTANEQGETYCHGHSGTWSGSSPSIGINPGKITLTSMLVTNTAPTIAGAGCGGSAATISVQNGTAAFKIGVGTAPGSACTVTMPTATTGWNCSAVDITTNSTSVFLQKQSGAENASQITITNYNDVAAATAFVANDVVKVACWAD